MELPSQEKGEKKSNVKTKLYFKSQSKISYDNIVDRIENSREWLMINVIFRTWFVIDK